LRGFSWARRGWPELWGFRSARRGWPTVRPLVIGGPYGPWWLPLMLGGVSGLSPTPPAGRGVGGDLWPRGRCAAALRGREPRGGVLGAMRGPKYAPKARLEKNEEKIEKNKNYISIETIMSWSVVHQVPSTHLQVETPTWRVFRGI